MNTQVATRSIVFLPLLIRLAIEVGEEKVTFQIGCPVIELAGKYLDLDPLTGQEDGPRMSQAIHVARLLHHALKFADEKMSLDGDAAMAFATGFLFGENCPNPLFAGDENLSEPAALDALSRGLPASPGEAFERGFIARREQLRERHTL
ncbi:MAG: hypothetical protein Q8O25_08235 [Sulfurisoma sp.]|nr:hypothetical protein [Sulfurisoma sp.]